MKTSTLTLYYKSLLNKDKNFILDNPSNGNSAVENYLSTLEKQVITGFQYVKHQVVLSIKINKSQDALNMGLDSKDLNYIKIQNDEEASPKYYFIVGKTWKAESTIELTLNMDTLNSFQFNKDYEINAKTLVKREHRDRFKKYPAITFEETYETVFGENVFYHTDLNLSQADSLISYSSVIVSTTNPHQVHLRDAELVTINGIRYLKITIDDIAYNTSVIRITYTIRSYYREIDLKSEEINTPVYKRNQETIYEQEGRGSINWSLYYKNKDTQDNSPVECYLLPDASCGAVYQTSDGKVNPNNTPSNGDYIIFYSQDKTGFYINVNGSDYQINMTTGWSWGTFQRWSLIAVRRLDADTIEVYRAEMEGKSLFFPSVPVFSGNWQKIYSGAYIQVETLQDDMDTRRVASLPSATTWIANSIHLGSTFTINFGTTATATILSTPQINRTLQENIKIIDVPYCPSSYALDNSNNLILPVMWALDTDNYMMKLRDTSARFVNDVTSGVRSILVDFIQNIPNVNMTNQKRFLKDSKLYHSDYYRVKFVYDSFGKQFELEKINFVPNETNSNYFQFRFVVSRNIVSKFLFSFIYDYKVVAEDYENVVAVSRNNEEVLYNSAYLNYVRSGFNYDVKAKERQEEASGLGIGLSALALVSSIVIGVATENPIAIAGAVAGGIGLAGQLVNYAKTTAQAEDNLQRKLQEAKLQAVSVMNADDVDLLWEYTGGNKAKMCYYKASDKMLEVLDDLFYYCGYKTDEQKIPYVRSRYWFNFVQASLIMEETNNLTEEIEKDIKDKFENGVTFLHYRQNKFDFKQEMENIETKLV